MSLTIEATMLFKIKAVRRDLRKFCSPTRFFILLDLNELSDLAASGGTCIQRLLRSKPECY